MIDLPRISIIMPAHNAGKYLQRAINSVVKQTYNDWELLIIDDHSTDDTRDIIKANIKRDHRIKYILGSNLGSGDARNQGIGLAQGEFLCFLDADDYYDETFLEKGIELVDKGYDCVVYDYQRLSGENKTLYQVKATPLECYSAVWNKMYSKKCWGRIRFPSNIKIEDFETVPIAVALAQKVGHVDGVYYNYLIHSNSITHDIDLNEPEETVKAVKLLLANQSKYNINFDRLILAKYVNDFLYSHLYTCISRLPQTKDKKRAYTIIGTYGKKVNNNYFNIDATIYNSNRVKRWRNNILIFLFRHNLFKTGIIFVSLLSRLFGKRGVK